MYAMYDVHKSISSFQSLMEYNKKEALFVTFSCYFHFHFPVSIRCTQNEQYNLKHLSHNTTAAKK